MISPFSEGLALFKSKQLAETIMKLKALGKKK
jgi:hypothetical protein